MEFTCLVVRRLHTAQLVPFRPFLYKNLPSHTLSTLLRIAPVLMPAYCLQDCHYFYRSALRLLNICTSICPLHA